MTESYARNRHDVTFLREHCNACTAPSHRRVYAEVMKAHSADSGIEPGLMCIYGGRGRATFPQKSAGRVGQPSLWELPDKKFLDGS